MKSRSLNFTIFLRIVIVFVFLLSASAGLISTQSATLPKIPTDGLIAYWNLDEGAGSVAKEVTGAESGRDLTVLGNVKWTEGKFGKAFLFDGSTVLVLDGAKYIKTYNLTVAFWARVDDFPVSDTGANLFMANGDLAAISWGAFDIGFFGQGLYSYVVKDFKAGAGDRISHGVNIGDQVKGKWKHYAVVYNTDEGIEKGRLYLDGKEIMTADLTQIPGMEIRLGNPKTANYKKCPFNIGGYTDTSGTVIRSIKGAMDDIAIYDRELSAKEINELAAHTTGAITSSSSSSKSSSATSSKISSSASSSETISESVSMSSEISSEIISSESPADSVVSDSTADSSISTPSDISDIKDEGKGISKSVTDILIAILIGAVLATIPGLVYAFGKQKKKSKRL